jgi:ketosteroid isomerase-like protein
VPDNQDAKATQALVKDWITANRTNDYKKLISQYADDVVWMDYGDNYGPLDKGNLSYALQYESGPDQMKIKCKSYLVMSNGNFAVIQATFTTHSRSTRKWVSMPATAILEFKDGKIIRESWYYNNSAMY